MKKKDKTESSFSVSDNGRRSRRSARTRRPPSKLLMGRRLRMAKAKEAKVKERRKGDA